MAFNETGTFNEGGRSITVSVNWDDQGVLSATASGVGFDSPFDETVTWTLTADRTGATVQFAVDPQVVCIAACVGVQLGKALLECILKNRGNAQAIGECLKGKVSGTIADIVQCIIECLAK